MPRLVQMVLRTTTVTLTNANEAYAVNVPASTVRGMIRARTTQDGQGNDVEHDVYIGHDAVAVTQPDHRFTLPGGRAWYEKDLEFIRDWAFYVASPDAGTIVEGLWWGSGTP